MTLDDNEKEMRRLAEHFLAQPNKTSELIDLCQKVLAMCAKREGKPAPAFDERAWQNGNLYLISSTGRKGPAVPCQYIVHDLHSVELKGAVHLVPSVAGYGEAQDVVLVDSDGLELVRAYLAVMAAGQVADFTPGPLLRRVSKD